MLVVHEAIQINYYHEINNRIRNRSYLVGLLFRKQTEDGRESNTATEAERIFLIADDIGYGDLSCNGSKTIHTPNVEKLAAQGFVLRMHMR